jgi:hypothetical protein
MVKEAISQSKKIEIIYMKMNKLNSQIEKFTRGAQEEI